MSYIDYSAAFAYKDLLTYQKLNQLGANDAYFKDSPTVAGLTVGALAGIVKAAAGVLSAQALGAANTKLFVNAAGNAPEFASGISMGTWNSDLSAVSDVSITGVGFKPSLVVFLCGIDATAGCMSIGFDNGTLHYCIAQRSDNGTIHNISQSYSVIQNVNSGANEAYMKIKSLDADGYTMERTKGGAPTGTCQVNWIAFR